MKKTLILFQLQELAQREVNTREIALMIQLEQQQHKEFWVGWVTYQLPISISPVAGLKIIIVKFHIYNKMYILIQNYK